MTQPQLPAEPQPEPDSLSSAPQAPPSTPDRWATGFNRLMQTVGLGMVIYQQAVYRAEPWLLVAALGMMVGGAGIQMLVRGLLNLLGGIGGGNSGGQP